jgi:myxalamid-type polyketide synthase MxaE and MxaD
MDDAQLQAMLRPKVQGTWNLHHLSANLDLQFFVLFSSTAAVLGASGLGHYAAANAFQDAFAHYRRGLGLPALSLNWGTWSIMRSASLAEQGRIAGFGMLPMPAAQALALLGDFLLEPEQPQVVIAAVNWGVLKPAYEARRLRPLLACLGVPDAAPTPVAEQEPPLPADYRAARPDERWDLLIAALRSTVAQIVGMADPSAIDLYQGLFEMGLDSLMSVELKTQLERQTGRMLPATLTFNYPTIAELAAYLEQQVLAVESPPPVSSVATALAADLPGPQLSGAPAAADLDDLSEDELETILLQRLKELRA